MKILTRDDTEYDEQYVTLADALEEIAALRKDAERYRWLRDTAFMAEAARLVQMMPGEMDAAIDAAMAACPAVGAANVGGEAHAPRTEL